MLFPTTRHQSDQMNGSVNLVNPSGQVNSHHVIQFRYCEDRVARGIDLSMIPSPIPDHNAFFINDNVNHKETVCINE